jgi:phthiocerol/phenolphthiocerol synthesis type-I polyketide synthase E
VRANDNDKRLAAAGKRVGPREDGVSSDGLDGVAIVGMSGRFPSAGSLSQFWDNLRNGVESISFFSSQELSAEGIPSAMLDDPAYIKAGAILDGIDLFDAGFFGFTPREAQTTDPQHRLFLECAWESLEDAGYDPDRFDGSIGVYAGASASGYLLKVYSSPGLLESSGGLRLMVGNDRDYLTTLVSYKLNLKGPSINVQTACSTALVAVHLACQGLINYECDMALAGGVSIGVPQKRGYLYQKGGINSPDGHCRAFDAMAEGTIAGNGLGIVVLRRLEDAVEQGDNILAVIKGSSVNNDGAAKIGYTAPGAEGQARVITRTQAIAHVDPDTISYVEAHGSGTPVGDPIEIAALTSAFRARTSKRNFCAIGSVKTNIGHLGAAAGAASLIKTVLALKNECIPPSLNFEQANPEIDFSNSPFYVSTASSEWTRNGGPRRAAVSSFGIGGTNAHLILEEAPEPIPSAEAGAWQLLTLSAKAESALEKAADQLGDFLQDNPGSNLADVAFTQHLGRKHFGYRRILVSSSVTEAARTLKSREGSSSFSGRTPTEPRPVVFMFPGIGDHYVDMGAGFYRNERVFREQVDLCADLLEPILGLDLRSAIYSFGTLSAEGPDVGDQPAPSRQRIDLRKMLAGRSRGEATVAGTFDTTSIVQPAIFVTEYALARLWMSWGVRPQAMIGYSIGEYVAACLSGVLSLPDAVTLVARRAQLIQGLDQGAMVAVSAPEGELTPFLGEELQLAAVNSPVLSVLAGTPDAVAGFEREAASREWTCRRLATTHAFHSTLMRPVSDAVKSLARNLNRGHATIPYLSNVTGTWITEADVANAEYWAQHLCAPVRFADGLRELFSDSEPVFLEVGPGRMLTSLVFQNRESQATEPVALPSIRASYESGPDSAFLLHTLGRLWLTGTEIDWKAFHCDDRRHRVPLPTYPFERERYWIGDNKLIASDSQIESAAIARGSKEGDSRIRGTQRPVATGSGLEILIEEIWCDLLGVTAVRPEDDFFDFGGDSMLAIRVTSRLEKALGVELPVRLLLEFPRVDDLARAVEAVISRAGRDSESHRAEAVNRPSIVVSMNPNGNLPPLFCVHPSNGSVFCYTDLSRGLGPDQPFYGLQAPGIEADEEIPATIEEIAARHILAMRGIQPSGPYFLGGWSMGGVIAYEMCRQLGSAQVGKLVLFDIAPPNASNRVLGREYDDSAETEWFLRDLERMIGRSLPVSAERLAMLQPEERMEFVLEQVSASNAIGRETELPRLRRLVRVFRQNINALIHYRPGPYPGPIVVLKASETAVPARSLVDLPKGIEVHLVPGRHFTILREPNVRIVAEKLRASLAADRRALSGSSQGA